MNDNPFDEKAATWDSDPGHIERAQAVVECIQREVELDTSMKTMEYGAGTALVSESLQSLVGDLTVVDNSEGMLAQIRAKVEAGRLPEVDVRNFDISGAEIPEDRYDLIITVLTLHHIEDLTSALSNFYRLLNPGGHLLIVDLDKEDGSFHGEGFGGHHGFDRRDLAAALIDADFADVRMSDCHRVERADGTYPMFLAVAAAETVGETR